MLGQDLPQLGEPGWPSQVFAAMTLGVGLASFALVLALIEQVGGRWVVLALPRVSRSWQPHHWQPSQHGVGPSFC